MNTPVENLEAEAAPMPPGEPGNLPSESARIGPNEPTLAEAAADLAAIETLLAAPPADPVDLAPPPPIRAATIPRVYLYPDPDELEAPDAP
jgi:hypothetical protein